MRKGYQVLLIANENIDANLIQKQLDRLDIEAGLEAISQKKQLEKKLGQNPPDLIISDYNLSEFTGMGALKIVRAKFPNLPFIFISEPVGEAKAVDAILQGASDFTTKENLDRLGPAIIREISGYEKQKSMDHAYQIADIGHWELDVKNENLFWSDAVKKLHEVDKNFEPDIDSAVNFYKEGYHRETIKNKISKALEAGEPFDVELKIISAKDNERWVRVAGESEFRNGECVRVYGSTQNITQRKKIEQKLRDVVEYSTNMFYRHGTDNVLTYVSPQAKKFLGYSPEEAKQKWMEFVTDHPANKKGYKSTQRAIETGEPQPDFELQLQKKNGEKIWVQVNEAPIVENGETVGIVGSLTDVTERKKSNQRLKELNEELEKRAEELAASNAELEQFAYVASHDLQEPLRMVSSFLSRLEKRYSDQLDEKAHQYINFAVDGAQRMRQIILDLLNYSRVGQHKLERQDINLNKLLTEIKKLEHAPIGDNGATVTWEDLPAVRGAETSIQQVFQNLISNAIKYHSPGTEPKVHIKSEETDTHWQFSVSDNGIGIKEEFQENIFTLFKRLHTQDEYSGTGIGLAVSKKIVERHGGQIWVESEEGEGSTFYFTIAKNEK